MQEEISRFLESRYDEISQAAGNGLLTVTGISVARNLETGVVRYSWTQSNAARAPGPLQEVLQSLLPEIMNRLSRRMRIKRLPRLSFVYDESLESADRVYRILNKLSLNRSDMSDLSDRSDEQ
ncbi:MAG: ribosome-binding factor A [Elusimicrobia bacterium]|nr:ribosome-binding factor A [Elusimicrobiota bacterium]